MPSDAEDASCAATWKMRTKVESSLALTGTPAGADNTVLAGIWLGLSVKGTFGESHLPPRFGDQALQETSKNQGGAVAPHERSPPENLVGQHHCAKL